MEKIENKFYTKNFSNIKNIIFKEMKNNNQYWINYYKGSQKYLNFLKFNSYLDRLRYYWDTQKIINAKKKLYKNINKINNKKFIKKKEDLVLKQNLKLNNSEFIIFKSIENSLKKYYLACGFKLKK